MFHHPKAPGFYLFLYRNMPDWFDCFKEPKSEDVIRRLADFYRRGGYYFDTGVGVKTHIKESIGVGVFNDAFFYDDSRCSDKTVLRSLRNYFKSIAASEKMLATHLPKDWFSRINKDSFFDALCGKVYDRETFKKSLEPLGIWCPTYRPQAYLKLLNFSDLPIVNNKSVLGRFRSQHIEITKGEQ